MYLRYSCLGGVQLSSRSGSGGWDGGNLPLRCLLVAGLGNLVVLEVLEELEELEEHEVQEI